MKVKVHQTLGNDNNSNWKFYHSVFRNCRQFTVDFISRLFRVIIRRADGFKAVRLCKYINLRDENFEFVFAKNYAQILKNIWALEASNEKKLYLHIFVTTSGPVVRDEG